MLASDVDVAGPVGLVNLVDRVGLVGLVDLVNLIDLVDLYDSTKRKSNKLLRWSLARHARRRICGRRLSAFLIYLTPLQLDHKIIGP